MNILSTNRNKILLLILISFLIFIGWNYGVETAYAKLLVTTSNISLGIINKDANIKYEKVDKDSELYHFKVTAVINGRRGSYPQEVGGILQPLIIILSWQIFLFFVINLKLAIRSLLTNFSIYMLIQIIFLILLSGYYNSTAQQFVFSILLDSFYIIALILIIKDNILFSVFSRGTNKKS